MSAKSVLRKGFKTEAEKTALSLREQMSLKPWSPLCAFELARHLKVAVWRSDDIASMCSELKSLMALADFENCGWSALTMPNQMGQRLIIHNHTHPPARQQSDVMHELAHILCGHEIELSLEEIALSLCFDLRKHNEEHEAEAECLGSTLQLPKPCLFWAKKRGMGNEEIAKHFKASIEMVNYRLGVSGVAKVLEYQARKRVSS